MKKRQESDHPKEGIRFLPFIGQTEKAEKTAVYTTQSPEVPKGTFRDCKQSPRSRASPDFGSSPIQKEFLASMYKGKHASNRVISVIFSVILNQRTSSTLQSSALKITELSAVEVGESRRDKSKPLLGT